MAGAKNHDYHILPPDIWPLTGALSALTMTSGGVLFMHSLPGGKAVMLLGLLGVLLTICLLYTSPSPRDLSTSRMPSSA